MTDQPKTDQAPWPPVDDFHMIGFMMRSDGEVVAVPSGGETRRTVTVYSVGEALSLKDTA